MEIQLKRQEHLVDMAFELDKEENNTINVINCDLHIFDVDNEEQ